MVGLQSQDGGKKGAREREKEGRDVGTREETNSTRVCMDA